MARRKSVKLDADKLKEIADEIERLADDLADLKEKLLDAAGVHVGAIADPAID